MNYFSTDEGTPRSAWCAVYDRETGEVVHVHEFIGLEVSDEPEHTRAIRAEVALAHVRQHTRTGAKNLAVVHGDPKNPPGIADRLAYDLKKQNLVTSREPLTLQEFARLESAAGEVVPDRPTPAGKGPKKAR
jgi:hypothetical protein